MTGEMKEKLAVLNGLAGNYAAVLSPETARMWLFLLKDYALAQVQAAALAVIRRYGSDAVPYRTMPPFALMQKELDALGGVVRGEENLKLQARAEWGRLLEAVRSCGSWRAPDLEPTTAYCVRSLGGWEQVCRWRMDELPWRERDFLQLWEQSHGKEERLTLGSGAVARLAGPRALDALMREALPGGRGMERGAESAEGGAQAGKDGPGAQALRALPKVRDPGMPDAESAEGGARATRDRRDVQEPGAGRPPRDVRREKEKGGAQAGKGPASSARGEEGA